MRLSNIALRAGLAMTLPLLLALLPLPTTAAPSTAPEYPDNEALTRRLHAVTRDHPGIVHLHRLADSLADRPVWLVELGSGPEADRTQRPALLVVAGIEGDDLVGSASALAWIEALAEQHAANAANQSLLETTTLYVAPRMNPDAAALFFNRPRQGVAVNPRPVDEDHDGLVDEDGPEDLNDDGWITSMRVEDPEGDHVLDPLDSRLLVKADPAKGERGAWRLLIEGTDNDGDEAWNEDGAGGVNLNRNFPFEYRFFAPWSGTYPLSEPGTRALAEFVMARPHIGIGFTFSATDNLLQTPKSQPGKEKPLTAISEEDLPYFRELGQAWRKTFGVEKELSVPGEPGTFPDWLYFHRGRLSLAARPWSPALAVALDQPSQKAAPKKTPADEGDGEQGEDDATADASPDTKATPTTKTPPDKRNQEARAYLRWIDTNAPGQFVAWQKVLHPDFPGATVEIGGWAPLAKNNPPAGQLPAVIPRHTAFLMTLAGKLPRIGIRTATARHLGQGVFEVTVAVENTGYLPTALGHGRTTGEVHPTRVRLAVEEQELLAGARLTKLEPIAGSGGMQELRWVLLAGERRTLAVEVISMLGGTAKTEIELKQE